MPEDDRFTEEFRLLTERVSALRSTLDLEVIGRPVRIVLETDADTARSIAQNFESLRARSADPPGGIEIVACTSDNGFRIAEPDGRTHHIESLADLVYCLEKAVTIEVQKQRPELLFLHAAALDANGRGIILVGDTGAGKSTTTWALLHEGFGYMSDELSPIALASMEVLSYPHALCLKRPPPVPYTLPGTTMNLGRTLHVPASEMPCPIVTQPRRLGAILLIRHDPGARLPEIRALTPAEAAARLYVNALNTLAHPQAGLPAVLCIASAAPCYAVVTADLRESCSRIRTLIEKLDPC